MMESKRKRWIGWIVVLILIQAFVPIEAEYNGKKEDDRVALKKEPTEYTVCIDPGHQALIDMTTEAIAPGSSIKKAKNVGGTSGIVTKTPEYRINMLISLQIKALLEKEGVRVVMTRMTDNVNISNIERAEIANSVKADLFVRIHCDGNNNSHISGTSVLYPSKKSSPLTIWEPSRKAAAIVLEELLKTCRRKNGGIVMRSDMTGFNWSKVPVILVEVAFLSNPEEDRLLKTVDFQKKAAVGISQGILRYFKESTK
jgi:N-acetylmuramoyl-L-alanine amidase